METSAQKLISSLQNVLDAVKRLNQATKEFRETVPKNLREITQKVNDTTCLVNYVGVRK